MFRHFSVVSFVVICLFSFLSAPVAAQGYDDLELAPVSAPQGFENSICFEVSYFQKVNGQKLEVFPARAEKEKDLDLILAQIVRRVIDTEYNAKGRYLDETSLNDSTPQEIQNLVSTDYLSKSWGKSSQKELSRYLQQNSNSLKLYKLDAYLDYADDKGSYFSGLDVDPILFRFGQERGRDLVTVIFINQTAD
ncbi:MAG TPA: hypothetical protein PKM25_02615 [Candidatus Ozemobacteraceae bacterium]|nr:hypothetical protein [Candidatus Ozemobacteraceae bacterium]